MNFNYNLPVNIIFGRGRVSEIGSEVLKYGKTALIVTGKNSTKKTGLLDRTIKLLNESDIKTIVFDKVEQNPLTTTAYDGAELAKKEKCDVVVGLGGGSIMDAAKAIAFITLNEGDVSDYILEYRKKFIEEYRDDEDKVMEYFDHERYVKEEMYRTIDRKLAEFTKLKESPYFGKVNFEDNGYAEQIYVGRYGLTPEGNFDAAIVDWRAPVASLFYKGTLGETSYKSPDGEVLVDILARRQIMIKKGKLEGFFDSDIDVKDDILQMILSSNIMPSKRRS